MYLGIGLNRDTYLITHYLTNQLQLIVSKRAQFQMIYDTAKEK